MRVLDYLLLPIMYILGGFKKPIQETHVWHIEKVNSKKFPDKSGLLIDEFDEKARFSHSARFGLFHMPIFGGLTKYVVIEVSGKYNYWNVVWKSENSCLKQKLKIKDSRLMLLTGKGAYKVFAMSNNNKLLRIKKIAVGYLGDGKFSDVRLF